MLNSRLINSKRNLFSGILLKLINIPLQLFLRVLIISYLSIEYIGVNSFMLSIINIIGAVELGFGIAMTQSLYKPIHEKNIYQIERNLRVFRFVYNRIGILILIIGFCILPLLSYFDTPTFPDGLNIYFVFLLFLIASTVNFFIFPQKIAIINAFERRDLIHYTSIFIKVSTVIVQILILFFTGNYYLFLSTMIVFPILRNIILSKLSLKIFQSKSKDKSISKKYLNNIFNKTKFVALHKIGDIALISIDNFMIVYFLGYTINSIYSNYIYIISALFTFIDVISLSLISSVGNVLIDKNKDENYKLFNKLTILNFSLISFLSVVLFILMEAFIHYWVGVQFSFNSYFTVLLFSLYLFFSKNRLILILYRDAAGIWHKDYLKPVVGVLLNVFFSALFVIYFGVNGVLASSIFIVLLVYYPWETYITHKYVFSKNMSKFLFLQSKFFLILSIIFTFSYYLKLNQLIENPLLKLIFELILIIIIFIPLTYYLFKKYSIINIVKRILKIK